MVMNNNIQRHITSSSKEMDVEEHSKWNPPDGDGVFRTRAQAKTATSETTRQRQQQEPKYAAKHQVVNQVVHQPAVQVVLPVCLQV